MKDNNSFFTQKISRDRRLNYLYKLRKSLDLISNDSGSIIRSVLDPTPLLCIKCGTQVGLNRNVILKSVTCSDCIERIKRGESIKTVGQKIEEEYGKEYVEDLINQYNKRMKEPKKGNGYILWAIGGVLFAPFLTCWMLLEIFIRSPLRSLISIWFHPLKIVIPLGIVVLFVERFGWPLWLVVWIVCLFLNWLVISPPVPQHIIDQVKQESRNTK